MYCVASSFSELRQYISLQNSDLQYNFLGAVNLASAIADKGLWYIFLYLIAILKLNS